MITENSGIGRRHFSNILVFDAVTKQIVLLDTYLITNLVKWVCLHCTIALFLVH